MNSDKPVQKKYYIPAPPPWDLSNMTLGSPIPPEWNLELRNYPIDPKFSGDECDVQDHAIAIVVKNVRCTVSEAREAIARNFGGVYPAAVVSDLFLK